METECFDEFSDFVVISIFVVYFCIWLVFCPGYTFLYLVVFSAFVARFCICIGSCIKWEHSSQLQVPQNCSQLQYCMLKH